MAIITFIEAEELIEKILKHLDLWKPKRRLSPRTVKPQPMYTEPWIDYPDSQIAPSGNQ